MGFKNQQLLRKWLTAKDIISPNWKLVEERNERLKTIFSTINKTLPVQYTGDIAQDVQSTYESIRSNGLLLKMNNNGRSIEDVYYTWMQGYICEKVFVPFICEQLMIDGLKRNGKDDISDITLFKRQGDADLINEDKKIMVEVQCGTHMGKCHIKKHKVDTALKQTTYTTYVFSVRLMYGTWCLINLNRLSESGVVFYKNELWENCLCWDIPDDLYSPYYGLSHFLNLL
jgi:hypothetical protein